ncbi:MAG: response regulator [Campylobacterota bacterium]|nr:response regulator [Campylobacterota bacterium]
MMNFDNLKNKTVLYVEDDVSIMNSFSKILNKVFGKVITAVNGKDGLELFKSCEDIDFVITDIKMPKMDGLEMSSEIKKLSPSTPCILTTAHAEYDYFLKADEIGIYRYITKPLNITELLNAISEFIELKDK